MIKTKLSLSDNKFEQTSGDTLNLSGCTNIYGGFQIESGGTLSILSNRGIGKVLVSDANGKGIWQTINSGSGTNITKLICQINHSFNVGNIIGWSGGTYNKAIADGTYNGEILGIVSKCYNNSCFDLTQSGYITGLTSLITNTTYFLSEDTNGLMTDVEPTTDGSLSKAVLIADSTTSGWVLPYAGYIVTTGVTFYGENGLNSINNTIELGGILNKNTAISGSCNNLLLGVDNNKLGILSISSTGNTIIDSAAVVIKNSPSIGTCNDQILVWNESTCEVNKIPYSSGGTVYTLTSPATCAVGGIGVGYVLTGKTLECIIRDAFAPYILPTFSAFNIATVSSPMEVGTSLSGTKTFSWTTTTPTNVETNSIGICQVGGSLLGSGLADDGSETLDIGTLSNTTPTTFTWQITGESTQNDFFSRNVSKCSIYPVYYGKLTSGSRPAVTNDLVTGGTKCVISSTGTVTISFGSSSSEYTWLAIPAISTSKTCWYRTALDNGRINNQPTDKYPDECTISISSGQGCWSAVNYKVYMSGSVGEISTAIEFRNS